MNDSEQSQNRLAVLIDADNAQPLITEGLLLEVAKYGLASVKRIYGDWTTPSLTGLEVCPAGALHPARSAVSLYGWEECNGQ
jgi:hypothetical protein